MPGGDLGAGGIEGLVAALTAEHPTLAPALIRRVAEAYGSLARTFLAEDMGEVFAGDLSAREVDYLIAEEFARTAEDILWRRTKVGLHATPEQVARLEAYVAERTEL